MSKPPASFLFPAYPCWPPLFPRGTIALRLCRSASRIRPLALPLCRLAATRLTCLAVNPTLPVVAAEPLVQAIAFFSCGHCCFPNSLRRLCGILPRLRLHKQKAIWCSETSPCDSRRHALRVFLFCLPLTPTIAHGQGACCIFADCVLRAMRLTLGEAITVSVSDERDRQIQGASVCCDRTVSVRCSLHGAGLRQR